MYVDLTSILKETGITVTEWATHIRNEITEATGCPCSTGKYSVSFSNNFEATSVKYWKQLYMFISSHLFLKYKLRKTSHERFFFIASVSVF